MASDSDSELHINFYPLNPAGSSDPPGGEKMASPAMSRKPSNFEISSGPGLKKRAVFDDLPTAYSSITSKTKSRVASHEDEVSIPLQDMPSSQYSTSPFLLSLPLPPPPAALPGRCLMTDDDSETMGQRSQLSAPIVPTNSIEPASLSATIFNGLKNALSSVTSPTPNRAKFSHWPRDSFSRLDSYQDLVTLSADNEPAQKVSSSKVKQIERYNEQENEFNNDPDPRKWGALYTDPAEIGIYEQEDDSETQNFTSTNRQSHDGERKLSKINGKEKLLPDVSTVGNIYNDYLSESECDASRRQGVEGSSSMSTNDQSQPSALLARRQRRAQRSSLNTAGQGQRLETSNPRNLVTQHAATSIPQEMGQSSSYGDTKNLLQLTQPTGFSGDANENDNHHGLKVHVSPASEQDGSLDRKPLERDVSEQLRRISAYSNCSISSDVNNFEHFRTERASSEVAGNPASFNAEAQPTTSHQAKSRGFYNQGAIASKWIVSSKQNSIRVPIRSTGPRPKLYTISQPNSIGNQQYITVGAPKTIESHQFPQLEDDEDQLHRDRTDEDANDWETVGESAMGGEFKGSRDTPGMLGGTTRRAGSSIADTSDDGAISVDIPEMYHYGSTERITQHPGNIEYASDYRQRELKDTKQPVFLPTYRVHKVNGYLSNSNRTQRPANMNNHLNYSPKPLERTHTNPFRSPPPEIKKDGVSSNYQHPTPSKDVERLKRNTFDWMDRLVDDPEPTFKNGKLEEKDDSWTNVIRIGRGSRIAGYNTDAPSTARQEAKDSPRSDQLDEFTDIPLIDPTEQRPLIKSRRANFMGMFDWSKTPRKASSPPKVTVENNSMVTAESQPSRSQKGTGAAYDTEALSPTDASHSSPGDFVYRSPLAPPRRKSTQMLYSPEQLRVMNRNGRLDGFRDSVASSFDGLRNSFHPGSSRRQLHEQPTLNPFRQTRPISTSGQQEMERFASIVLACCCIFPPLLALYGWGTLDSLMVWKMDGEYVGFGRQHKRFAWAIVLVYAVLLFTAFVTLMVYKFAPQ